MLSFGVVLVVIGVASFLLPMVGVDLAFLDSIDAYQPWLGIIVAALGLITVLYGGGRRKKDVSQTVNVSDNTPPPSQGG